MIDWLREREYVSVYERAKIHFFGYVWLCLYICTSVNVFCIPFPFPISFILYGVGPRLEMHNINRQIKKTPRSSKTHIFWNSCQKFLSKIPATNSSQNFLSVNKNGVAFYFILFYFILFLFVLKNSFLVFLKDGKMNGGTVRYVCMYVSIHSHTTQAFYGWCRGWKRW